jgi:putative spermidine/putrescine transport system permease protein
VLLVTMEIVFIVVVLSIVIGVPAAYAPARRDFPGKKAVLLLFLLPLLVPSITYGIPLATVLYQARLAGTMNGVIVANLVPTVPFVVLVMTPYIEQIDPRLEAAARVFGAGTFRVFRPRRRARSGASNSSCTNKQGCPWSIWAATSASSTPSISRRFRSRTI